MILVVTAQRDPSSDLVLRWLERLGAPALRLNAEDTVLQLHFELGGELRLRLASGLHLEVGALRCSWQRRGLLPAPLGAVEPALRPGLAEEWAAARALLQRRLDQRPSLGRVPYPDPERKLIDLEVAASLGLAVPATRVCTSRDALLDFLEHHPRAVCKPLAEPAAVELLGQTLVPSRVRRLTREQALALPERLWPTLIQEEIPRLWDLRVFLLDDRLWAVATPDGEDPDGRTRGGLRGLPIHLPPRTAARLQDLLAARGLDTASVDLVRRPDGEDVFLECNPSGQFHGLGGVWGEPLERRVAEALIRRAT